MKTGGRTRVPVVRVSKRLFIRVSHHEPTNQEGTVSEPEQKNADRVASSPASTPDDLVKDLEVKVSEEDQNSVTGGAADIFAKIGDIKGESASARRK